MGNHAKSKPQLLTGGVKCGWRVGIGWPLLREAAASPSMVVVPAQSKSRTLADHRERREASTALRGMSGAALASVSAGGASIWWYHGMLFGIRGFVGGQLWRTQGHRIFFVDTAPKYGLDFGYFGEAEIARFKQNASRNFRQHKVTFLGWRFRQKGFR